MDDFEMPDEELSQGKEEPKEKVEVKATTNEDVNMEEQPTEKQIEGVTDAEKEPEAKPAGFVDQTAHQDDQVKEKEVAKSTHSQPVDVNKINKKTK